MALLIPAIRGSDLDAELAAADYAIWGVHPTVWLERIQTPALTEVVQWLYSLFVPAVLLVAFILWRRRRYEDFRRYAFLIALGFLVSYAGYLAVPARGPRFLLAHLQHTELRGLWLYEAIRVTLDRLESAHYDCFPSGHTELTMLAWWGSRSISRRLSGLYLPYTLSIFFATVYLRYHYTVDVLAGAAVAVGLMVATPYLYQILEGACRWETSKSFGSGTGRHGINS
jgi:membrane-associated phospholipid phosphatase